MTPETGSGHMQVALSEARLAAGRGEVPVGALLVAPNGKPFCSDGNRMRERVDPTAHAEVLVIRQACQALGTERLVGFDLYVTLEPCAMCAAAISFARIRRLYFAASDPKMGAVENGPRLFNQTTCHHAPDVYGGLAELESAALLRSFFEKRR